MHVASLSTPPSTASAGLPGLAALEKAPYDITLNALCPGYVDTHLVRNQVADLPKTRHVPENRVLDEVILSLVPCAGYWTRRKWPPARATGPRDLFAAHAPLGRSRLAGPLERVCAPYEVTLTRPLGHHPRNLHDLSTSWT